MDLRHPVQTLEWALMRALDRDLAGRDSSPSNDPLSNGPNGQTSSRPSRNECNVVMFSQCWRGTDLGLHCGPSVGENVDAETVIVTGPSGDACVYVATRLLYRIAQPNRRFFLDVAAQQMRPRSERDRYEGRDTEDEEAFDFEVAGTLARLREVVRHGAPGDGLRIARALVGAADEMRAADSATQLHRKDIGLADQDGWSATGVEQRPAQDETSDEHPHAPSMAALGHDDLDDAVGR